MDVTGFLAGHGVDVISTCIATGAAVFAFMSARQSKRQADAVLGNLLPSFATFQLPAREWVGVSDLAVEIVNHNRRGLLIHGFSLEYPETVMIYRESDDTRDLIASIIHSSRSRSHTFNVPLRLGGCSLNSEPQSFETQFVCQWRSNDDRQPVIFGLRVDYGIEGFRGKKTAYASTVVIPPLPGL